MVYSRCSTEGSFLLSFLLPQLLQWDPATPPIDLENAPIQGRGVGTLTPHPSPLIPLPLAQIPISPPAVHCGNCTPTSRLGGGDDSIVRKRGLSTLCVYGEDSTLCGTQSLPSGGPQ